MDDNKPDHHANAWYDQINDAQPFDAFGSTARKKEIGNEIYNHIRLDITRKRKRFFLPLKIAAAVLIVMVNSVVVYRYFQHPVVKETPAIWMTVSSGVNEVKKITLPDSSIIQLKGSSSIRYAAAFQAGAERRVELQEGAAFFDVQKDAVRPFTVYAKGFRIRVLGTSFNISAYKDQPDFKVDVVSGKIRVEQEGPSATKILAEELTKDECLTVELATTDFKIEKKTNTVSPKPKPVNAIRRLTLHEIAKGLGDKFNLFVQLNNPDNDTSTYVIDLNHSSLEEVLKTLTEQTTFSYTIVNGQHLIIQPKTAKHMK
ncbi:hypothetical protein GFS24_03840 [Chitinophaga sp. SYP-B3965]|uniref:FecR family protein n=1 Tax=Chitinophaga sp. SYP-B3965 TaxID=2663120 RepID=UPI001299D4B4|nr:FecR family protein [Chitinophaga sp. SYP-B3965]MRG44228.1 hypothetical protein [Chitinophaga sp. SYP-B3965]